MKHQGNRILKNGLWFPPALWSYRPFALFSSICGGCFRSVVHPLTLAGAAQGGEECVDRNRQEKKQLLPLIKMAARSISAALPQSEALV